MIGSHAVQAEYIAQTIIQTCIVSSNKTTNSSSHEGRPAVIRKMRDRHAQIAQVIIAKYATWSGVICKPGSPNLRQDGINVIGIAHFSMVDVSLVIRAINATFKATITMVAGPTSSKLVKNYL